MRKKPKNKNKQEILFSLLFFSLSLSLSFALSLQDNAEKILEAALVDVVHYHLVLIAGDILPPIRDNPAVGDAALAKDGAHIRGVGLDSAQRKRRVAGGHRLLHVLVSGQLGRLAHGHIRQEHAEVFALRLRAAVARRQAHHVGKIHAFPKAVPRNRRPVRAGVSAIRG